MMTPQFSVKRKNMKPIQTLLIAALALIVPPGIAAAQEDLTDLGTFTDWQATSYKEGGKAVCTMFTTPKKSTGKYTSRGEVYVFVTNRPAANRNGEVSVKIGYTFQAGVPVVVTIGGAKFELFSDRDSAWTRSANADRNLVNAMRRGATMQVDGVSSFGTQTTDIFSLSGFTAAYNAISRACPVR